MKNKIFLRMLVLLVGNALLGNSSAQAQVVKLNDVKPDCGSEYFEFKNGKCEMPAKDPKDPQDLTDDKCNALPGLEYVDKALFQNKLLHDEYLK